MRGLKGRQQAGRTDHPHATAELPEQSTTVQWLWRWCEHAYSPVVQSIRPRKRLPLILIDE